MSQNECACDKPVIEIPLRGLKLELDAESFPSGGVSGDPSNLAIGVETKRNMTYMGKQVYSQLFNYGNLPATKGEKMVEHHIPNVEWIQVDSSFSVVREPDGLRALGVDCPVYQALASATMAGFSTSAGRGSYTSILCLNYTKTTDPVIV